MPDVQTAVVVVAGTGSIITSFCQGAADACTKAVARMGSWGWILRDEGGGFNVAHACGWGWILGDEGSGFDVTRVGSWGWILGDEGGRFNVTCVGSWGWILRDEGGGFDVACMAVCTLLTQQDMEGSAVAHGPLREKLLKKFGVSNVMNLLGVMYTPDSSSPLLHVVRVSSIYPLMFEAVFEDGDPLAVQVVRDCAHKLAMQITAVLLHFLRRMYILLSSYPGWQDIASYSSEQDSWSRSLGMPLARIRERNTSNSGWTFLRYKNWVRKGKHSDLAE